MYGAKIRKLRGKITQEEFAKRLGVSRTTVVHWEQLSYPPLEAIEKVCGYMEVPMWKFFAPDDLVVDEVEPDLAEWVQIFRKSDPEIQGLLLDSVKVLLLAVKKGKKL